MSTKCLFRPAFFLALASLGAACAHADIMLQFSLSGLVATPPNDSTATGGGVATINEMTRQIRLDGTYSGLSTNAFAAHIHGTTAGGAAILIGLQISGGMDGTLRLRDTLTIPEMDAILAGDTYVNVHTSMYMEGEIAGYITTVPEPGSALLVVALAVAAARPAISRFMR